MPRAAKKKSPPAAEQRAVIRALNQSVAAELADRPTSWLRDDPTRAGRNLDGSYDGTKLVANLVGSLEPVELDGELLEGVRQVVEAVMPHDERWDVAVAAIEKVEARYGGAGLAAVGLELLRYAREWANVDPFKPHELPAEADYVRERVDEAAANEEARARRDYANMANGWGPRMQGRLLYVCGGCKRYRMGRSWFEPPLPKGYAEHDHADECPRCRDQRKAKGKR